ncbi:hypothetical protein T484DRAFT_1882694 [Baffinella frigidus]|nr:hypothetical protein T484DRAFT_1882694 [Cryptophyta sp. CCMP2293]
MPPNTTRSESPEGLQDLSDDERECPMTLGATGRVSFDDCPRTPDRSMRSPCRTPQLSPATPSRPRRRLRGQGDEHHDDDADISEKATVLSEGSTLNEDALLALHGGASAFKYVRETVHSGDSVDVLRLSCALGYLVEVPGARTLPGNEAESRIDDVVFNARKHFRRVAKALRLPVSKILASGNPDLAALLRLVLKTGLELFCTHEGQGGQGGRAAGPGGGGKAGVGEEEQTSFMHRLGMQQRCRKP